MKRSDRLRLSYVSVMLTSKPVRSPSPLERSLPFRAETPWWESLSERLEWEESTSWSLLEGGDSQHRSACSPAALLRGAPLWRLAPSGTLPWLLLVRINTLNQLDFCLTRWYKSCIQFHINTCPCSSHVGTHHLPDEALQNLIERVPLASLTSPSQHLHKVRLLSSLTLLGSTLF